MDIKNGSHIKSKLLKINIDLIFQWLNKSIPVLIGIFIFFNPFPHTTAVKEICFYLSVLIVLILYLFKKKDFDFKTPFMLSFALFVSWSFLGLFFALDKNNSIHDFYSHLMRYIILYFILINLFRSKKTSCWSFMDYNYFYLHFFNWRNNLFLFYFGKYINTKVYWFHSNFNQYYRCNSHLCNDSFPEQFI